MQRREFLALTIAALALSSRAMARPANWATPLKLEGVGNFHRVTDNLFRGAQPKRNGFKNLERKYGITTVLDLQIRHSDAELASGTKLRLIKAPMVAHDIDAHEGAQLVQALRLIRRYTVTDKLFVHCTHGADRTGAVMALWRMTQQGWTAKAALDEMQKGDFNFHSMFGNIPDYLMRVDVKKLRLQISG